MELLQVLEQYKMSVKILEDKLKQVSVKYQELKDQSKKNIDVLQMYKNKESQKKIQRETDLNSIRFTN